MAAAKVLGVQVCEILTLTNRELMDSVAARLHARDGPAKAPSAILVGMAGRTPAASPDHYQAQLLTEAVRFCSQLTKWDDRFGDTRPHRIDHLLYRPVPQSAEIPNWPSRIVVDISETLEQKLEAIACYKSQFNGERIQRLHHYVRSTAGYEGAMCGFTYGELFALPRPVGTTDVVALLASGTSAALRRPAALGGAKPFTKVSGRVSPR